MAVPTDTEDAVLQVVDRIQRAWRAGPLEDMAPVLAPDITFVFPGFSMRLTGRDRLIESYREFTAAARLRSYREDRRSVEGGATAALAEVEFDMTYSRGGSEWRAHGIELWALERRADGWIAFWRTMQELTEEPAVAAG
ncbi:MAG TPA: nuclear transport factor 2 family protein [Myxococcaceae bacterium]|nr:nuclear transport factor 2 family protein [Myxococcaceae bacterium]